MIQSLPFSISSLVLSQAAARARAFEAPIAEAVEIGEDAIFIFEHVVGLRVL